MRVLITGATGFIGQYVYNKLINTNHEIFAVSRKSNNASGWYQADVLNYNAMIALIEEINADVLIHLAWDVTHDEFWHSSKNELYKQASMFLFESFIQNGGKKIIAAGTCAEYQTSNLSLPENSSCYADLCLYGQSKREVFDFLQALNNKVEFGFTWFRVFGLYGSGENENRFFPSAIRSILKKEPFDIKNPKIFSDYVYVDDLAKFIVACIDMNGLGPINIGTGQSFSLLDIYSYLKKYCETGVLEMKKNILDPDMNSRIPDCTKLLSLNLKFSLENGFSHIIKELYVK